MVLAKSYKVTLFNTPGSRGHNSNGKREKLAGGSSADLISTLFNGFFYQKGGEVQLPFILQQKHLRQRIEKEKRVLNFLNG